MFSWGSRHSFCYYYNTFKRGVGRVKMVLNRLHAMGHRVQSTRVRDAMSLLFGQRQRNLRLKRRVYSVRAPLSVIHFDGNHNLIM